MIRSMPLAMAAARSVSEFLTSPSKVAQTLDWKKHSASVLNIIISKEKIDLAVARHPECQSYDDDNKSTPTSSMRLIRPIQLSTKVTNENRRVLNDIVPQSFVSVINDYNVCGIIVGWPVEREGWCGASCGRVLNTLDQLIQSTYVTKTRLFTNNRPITLYDIDHHTSDEDEWGRTAIYTEICHDPIHISSEEQSYNDFVAMHNSSPLQTMWNDFCHLHWPHLFQLQSSTVHCSDHNTITPMKTTTHDDSYPAIFG